MGITRGHSDSMVDAADESRIPVQDVRSAARGDVPALNGMPAAELEFQLLLVGNLTFTQRAAHLNCRHDVLGSDMKTICTFGLHWTVDSTGAPTNEATARSRAVTNSLSPSPHRPWPGRSIRLAPRASAEDRR